MAEVKINQAVILAGGKGKRLRPLTLTRPKPMIPIHGRPFLEYIIRLLQKNKIKEVILLVGYLHKEIENYFGDGKEFGLRITYSYSPVEADTGTRLREAKDVFAQKFLLLYGDNYWPLKLEELTQFYQQMSTLALVTVYSNHDNSSKNNMLVSDKELVKVYDRPRKRRDLNGVDIGFFILDKKVLSQLPPENFSFEEVVIPRLIRNKQLAGFLTHHKYYSLSNLTRIPVIEKYFKKKKTIFLDRDGVINKKPPKAQYVTEWEDFKFLPKVKEAMGLLQKKDYRIFIISNQAGIARGMLTKQKVDKINEKLRKKLEEFNVKIEDIYVCPHGWDEGCFCRKPNPGLFFKAAAAHQLELYESYCLGDDSRDLIAGKAAGCKTILINKKNTLYEVAKKLP